jgi:hypothetical protein
MSNQEKQEQFCQSHPSRPAYKVLTILREPRGLWGWIITPPTILSISARELWKPYLTRAAMDPRTLKILFSWYLTLGTGFIGNSRSEGWKGRFWTDFQWGIKRDWKAWRFGSIGSLIYFLYCLISLVCPIFSFYSIENMIADLYLLFVCSLIMLG